MPHTPTPTLNPTLPTLPTLPTTSITIIKRPEPHFDSNPNSNPHATKYHNVPTTKTAQIKTHVT